MKQWLSRYWTSEKWRAVIPKWQETNRALLVTQFTAWRMFSGSDVGRQDPGKASPCFWVEKSKFEGQKTQGI